MGYNDLFWIYFSSKVLIYFYNVKQEQQLAVAASRFAECQKTISSLAQQLKSLASVDDFFVDSDPICDNMDEGLLSPENELHHLNRPPVLISAEER